MKPDEKPEYPEVKSKPESEEDVVIVKDDDEEGEKKEVCTYATGRIWMKS